jgi:hypothetical protein
MSNLMSDGSTILEMKREILAKSRRKSNEAKGFIIFNLFGFINHDWM